MQCRYKRNIEAGSRNHCCSEKLLVLHICVHLLVGVYMCVCVCARARVCSLIRPYYVVICGLTDFSTVFDVS